MCDLNLSRREASIRQARAAMEAFKAGDWDACLVLAHAAEGVLPNEANTGIYDRIKARIGDPNEAVNWLKHGNNFDRATIRRDEAIAMMARALLKLEKERKELPSDLADFLTDFIVPFAVSK